MKLITMFCKACSNPVSIDMDGDVFQQAFNHAWNEHPITIENILRKKR